MYLFHEEIQHWKDWERIFFSIPVFSPLIKKIMQIEKLRAYEIEKSMPGTNAVFKAGNYVIKIYPPVDSGLNGILDMENEARITRSINAIGVESPCIVANGIIKDKYDFAYIIMNYIEGLPFRIAVKSMSDMEKELIGVKLRDITNKLNVPSNHFSNTNVLLDVDRQSRWEKYSKCFQRERLNYIKAHNYGKLVLVHGDLNGDNILINSNGKISIIDFAESVQAPKVYEDALIAIELFNFDKSLLVGYFGGCNSDTIAQTCFDGLLIHDFGGDIIKHHLGEYRDFKCLEDLHQRIKEKFSVQ
ncbi:hypothetical protein IMSAGC019_00327 [Lachnospiraceae bacterium]|uniref:aminoglycoside phosphotransferase family protein n=1 Tax=Colidextribacter sp. OB.20 TaxID=2304568 RepID=UPI00136E1590|nr:aminoglycoside phosphotransferase family protein [Colidextribacter sp. OB.20]GFI45017.1 hypothetical protein IMSAGC019_00327 [Lachnospiraceae bacterium]